MADAEHPTPGMQRLLRSGAIYSLSDSVVAAAGLVVVPLYTSRLTQADYGLLGVLSSARQFMAPILALGLVAAFRTLYHAGDELHMRRLLSTIVNAGLLWALGVTAVGTVLCAVLLGSDDLPYRVEALVTVWTVLLSSAYVLPLALFTMQRRPAGYAIFSVGVAAITVVANVVLVGILDLGVLGALEANLVAGITSVAVGVAVTRPHWSPIVDRTLLRAALRISLPQVLHTLAIMAWRFYDRIFITAFASLRETGVYTVAMTIAMAVPLLLGGLSTAFIPEYFRRAADGDADLPRAWSRLTTVFVCIAGWLTLAASVLAHPFIDLVGSDEYDAAADLIPLLALGHAVGVLFSMFGPVVEWCRQTWIYPAAAAPAVAVSLGLNLVLVPDHGADGAAIAFLAASAVQLVAFVVLSQRAERLPLEWRSFAGVALVGGALFGAARAVSGDSVVVTTVVAFAAVAVFPVALVVAGIVSRDDLRRASGALLRSRDVASAT